MSFAELADQRRLGTVASALGELEWDVEADTYLEIDPPSNVEGIVSLMVRRGLEPALVSRLFDCFPARPLERALLAWDVLRGALLGPQDQPLVDRLHRELAPLAQLGATSAVAIHRDRVPTLIEAVGPTGDGVALMDDFLTTPSLQAVMALTAIHEQRDTVEPLVQITLDHAKGMAQAHLPSLALAFVQILWHRFASHAALELLHDIALDHELLEALPVIADNDDLSLQRQAYVELRTHLATYDMLPALVAVLKMDEVPAVRQSQYPPLLFAKAELELLQNKQLDAAILQAMQAIVPPTSLWRYGVRVRDSAIMQSKPHLAVGAVRAFIPKLGNSVRLWRRAGRHADARPQLLSLLSREVRYVSHEPEVWRAVAFFSPHADAIKNEISERLTSQLTAALPSS